MKIQQLNDAIKEINNVFMFSQDAEIEIFKSPTNKNETEVILREELSDKKTIIVSKVVKCGKAEYEF